MNSSILQHIRDKYHGKMVQNRVFFLANGYAATAFTTDSLLIISFELADLSRNPSALNAIAPCISYPCEYNVPSLNISICPDADNLQNNIIIDAINNIVQLLEQNNIKPNSCIKCMQKTDEYYNVNGYFCPIHKDCANELLKKESKDEAVPINKKIKGILIAAAFSLFGSLFFIIFALLGIMPALGGIMMGILASLGYKFSNNKISKKEKFVLFFIFLIFCAFSNTLADFIYSTSIGKQLDFVMTYTDILNLFGTVFDILAGAIIALTSLSIITDWDLHKNTCNIKKIPTDKPNKE